MSSTTLPLSLQQAVPYKWSDPQADQHHFVTGLPNYDYQWTDALSAFSVYHHFAFLAKSQLKQQLLSPGLTTIPMPAPQLQPQPLLSLQKLFSPTEQVPTFMFWSNDSKLTLPQFGMTHPTNLDWPSAFRRACIALPTVLQSEFQTTSPPDCANFITSNKDDLGLKSNLTTGNSSVNILFKESFPSPMDKPLPFSMPIDTLADLPWINTSPLRQRGHRTVVGSKPRLYTKCQICGNKICCNRAVNLQNHARRHSMWKQFQCRYCSYEHTEIAKVRLHASNNHPHKTDDPINRISISMQATWNVLMTKCFPDYLDGYSNLE